MLKRVCFTQNITVIWDDAEVRCSKIIKTAQNLRDDLMHIFHYKKEESWAQSTCSSSLIIQRLMAESKQNHSLISFQFSFYSCPPPMLFHFSLSLWQKHIFLKIDNRWMTELLYFETKLILFFNSTTWKLDKSMWKVIYLYVASLWE